jgi:TolA-binding protein
MSEKGRIESTRYPRRTARAARNGGAALFLAGALAYAPYQCGKPQDRSLREETPGEALYGLALKMKADGDEQGYRTTLRYIVARYPSSRQAAAARIDLAADAGDADAP